MKSSAFTPISPEFMEPKHTIKLDTEAFQCFLFQSCTKISEPIWFSCSGFWNSILKSAEI